MPEKAGAKGTGSKAYETAQALKAQKDPEGRAELKTKLQELFRYINDIKNRKKERSYGKYWQPCHEG